MAPRRPHRHRPWTAATAAGVLTLILPAVTLARLYARTGSLLPLAWTGILSSVTFLNYGYDKMQARNNEWRIRETSLHILELLGGWPGALAGQHFFQHKTRKTSFQFVFWTIVLGWQGLWWALLRGEIQFPRQQM
ncbi:hypothetical protein B0J11DRAFT_436035 [Dendryphion nanum]|uniref:DUF1294-domain-containing protein n=1 Tax=Dendryphion nanum TaxID=256645 RepID=A0A9P9DQX8_9PLEO|nr:hypothetical protein B0J11DRAFT_436035 [Dendryphion nanum]